MNWYPFDTQVCSLVISVSEDLNDFITLSSNGQAYLGPVELTQYFVRNTEVVTSILQNGHQAVAGRITLGRRLLGTILTVFFPTVLMNVVGHAANYFKPFFFEAVISINLTVMLVLMTMFISVSQQLPKTSYIKMIDIWLIFNLLLPFMEVLLHTYMDYLRNDDDREVNHHGTTIKPNQMEDDSTITQVQPADSVDSSHYKLDLVSRNEEVQVAALRNHYAKMKENEAKKNEKRLL